MASAMATLRQQDPPEEAARAHLVREGQLATQVGARRRERVRSAADLRDAGLGVAR